MYNYRINRRLSFGYFHLQSSHFLSMKIYFYRVMLCRLLPSSGEYTETGINMGPTGSDFSICFLAPCIIKAKEILIEIYVLTAS